MTTKKNMLTLLVIAGLMLSVPIALAKNQAATQDKGKPNAPTNEGVKEEQKSKPLVPKAADNGFNGQGKADHLYLYQKVDETPDVPNDPWTIVPDGAWGKMNFKEDMFVFNAHGLTPGEEYSLIYYPDPWPGEGLKELGSAVVDADGNVHIKGSFPFSSIPITVDANDGGDGDAYDYAGSKIWLVLKSDIGATSMIGWQPDSYLFEYQLIPSEAVSQ